MYLSTCISEYSGQLPVEGGAFYHPDCVESARQHYKKEWPPILHALAIWLNETGFSYVDIDRQRDLGSVKKLPSLTPANATPPANMNPEEINSDRLYLILGTFLLCKSLS